jgi:hypothetical protein
VTTAGGTASATQTLRVGTLRSMAVGSSLVVSAAPELACTDLSAANGRYIVSVFNTAELPTASSAFRIIGSVTTPVPGAPAPGFQPAAQMSVAPTIQRMQTKDELLAAKRDSAHARMMEINRALFPTVRTKFQQMKSSIVAPRANMAALPVVGDTRNFRINTGAGSCSGYNEVTAKVVYVGTKAILYEDIAAPLAGTMNSYYAQMGQAFDATMYASDLANFADPLVTDPYTDADQHINMVFSKRVNDQGLAGFVIVCDFYARNLTDNTSSNLGEVFYARVPTVAGTGYASETPDYWYWTMRTTVVHEVKHIASVGWRLVNNATVLEDSWLEETTAMHAEELWLRNYVYPAAWKTNITYANSIYCEVRPTFAQCAGRPNGIRDHFANLYSFMDNPGTHSPFGRIATGDFNFYYSGWSLVRWSADRYASSEASFFQGLTQTLQTGLTNLQARTGATTMDILANWSLALYLDGNSAFTGNANVNIASWNFRDIYSGLNADFATTYPKPYPLIPVAMNTGDVFADMAAIRGGSFAMFDFSGSAPSGRAISVVGTGGVGPVPPTLRMSIARLQ